MAVPPLAYQIAAARRIVLCATEIAGEAVSYRVRGIWKADAPLAIGEALRLDTRVHELLGYRPVAGQDVVLFFGAEPSAADRPLEILPVVDGAVTYSPHDRSVREVLTPEELGRRVGR